MNKIIFSILVLSTLFSACSSKKPTEGQVEAPAEVTEIRLTPDQIKVLALQYGDLQRASMGAVLQVQGKIDLPPQNLISVNFPLGGYLKSTKLIPGMKVSKGEVIAVMEDQSIVQLQQDYLSAKTKLDLAKFEYERQRGLIESNAGTSRAFQQAEAEWKLQQVTLRSLAEKLKIIGLDPALLNEGNISGQVSVRSTINGFVSKVNVNTGKYVQPTETMFELLDPDDIHVALTLFEKDLPYVKKGNKVGVRFVDNLKAVFPAEVILVNRGVDDDRTATAHCHFKTHPENILPGMFVEAEVAIDAREVNVLPDEAIVRSGNAQYVFVKKAADAVDMKEVKTGLSKEGKTEVVSGLEGTASGSIVLNNAYKLLGILKNSGEEE